jgi:hypothetical protein
MDDDGIVCGDERFTASDEGQPEIAVLPPGHCEPLVEPADGLER